MQWTCTGILNFSSHILNLWPCSGTHISDRLWFAVRWWTFIVYVRYTDCFMVQIIEVLYILCSSCRPVTAGLLVVSSSVHSCEQCWGQGYSDKRLRINEVTQKEIVTFKCSVCGIDRVLISSIVINLKWYVVKKNV